MVDNQSSDRGFVVVTGTSTGIGAATVSRLANKGFHVFAGVRREADAEAARSIANGAVTPLMIDITDPSHRHMRFMAHKKARSTTEPGG